MTRNIHILLVTLFALIFSAQSSWAGIIIWNSTSPLPSSTVGTPYSYQLQVTGDSPPFTFTIVSGSLPSGLNLNLGGLISGTPTVAGPVSVTIRATETALAAAPNTVDRIFSLTILPASPPLSWNSTSPLPSSTVGTAYSYQLQATGGVPPIIYGIISGILPSGLTLSTSGLISGTPTVASSTSMTIRATDSAFAVPQTVDRTFSLTLSLPSSDATADLRVRRLQIYFDNNRPEITVDKNQLPPKVFANLKFVGSGLLQGYWEVDGMIHSRVHRTLIYGSNLILSPPAPPLPTYQTGGHRVRLVITNPAPGTIPEAIYYVTEKEKKVFLPINILFPADRAVVNYSPAIFSWQFQKNTAAYLIEFFEKEGAEPLFSAYTKKAQYTIPSHILGKIFSGNSRYFWRIKGFSDDSRVNNESALYHFTLRASANQKEE